MEALTLLLQQQGIQNANVVNSTSEPEALNSGTLNIANNKRRRVGDVLSSSGPNDSPIESTPAASKEQCLDIVALDNLVSHETQLILLERYLNKQFIAFPLVPISGDCSLVSLRAERPVLVYAIMYAAGPGVLPLEEQEGIAKVLLDHLTNLTFSPDCQSLDTIQAILITCLFYRSPKHHVHLSVFGLIEVGIKSVAKLGHGGPLSAPRTTPIPSSNTDVDSLDAWRAILVSHLLATAMAIFRRRKPSVSWEKEHDLCNLQLQVSVNYDDRCAINVHTDHTCVPPV